jgi:hypothetical protein
MIVTLNPAFDSMRGSLDRIVFYTCHGQVRARSYAVPRDPKTASQRACRSAFANAVRAWRELSGDEKNCWKTRGKRKRVSGYNAFISAYLKKEEALKAGTGISAPVRADAAGTSLQYHGLDTGFIFQCSLESTSFPVRPSSGIGRITFQSCSCRGS